MLNRASFSVFICCLLTAWAQALSAQTLADLNTSRSSAFNSINLLLQQGSPDGFPREGLHAPNLSSVPGTDLGEFALKSAAFSQPISLDLGDTTIQFQRTNLIPVSRPASLVAPWPNESCLDTDRNLSHLGCPSPTPLGSSLWMNSFDPLVATSVLAPANPRERFHWGPALWQSFTFLVTEHAFRLATDPYARYLVVHRPFWYDYRKSIGDFHMDRWGDGDSFLVNYIGHPLQGAVSGNIFLQNDPQGRAARFGKSSAYWHSRLKAWVWAAAYSTYFEIGPVLSEAALGNEGGYTYLPGCGWYLKCQQIPGKVYSKPPTNNTGWVDFIITPTVGMGWIVMENAIENELVDRLAKDSPALKYKLLRSALAPSRTMANAMAGKKPWYRYPAEDSVAAAFGAPFRPAPVTLVPEWKLQPRWSTGVHFVSVDLPMDTEKCHGCRKFNSGGGFDFGYRLAQHLYFDSEVNFFPGSGGYGSKGGAQEYLWGLKIGHTAKSWGIFSQVRPGFIHYEKTLAPGSSSVYISSTRFVLDLGGSIEYYASPRSTLRFRMGTMLVHYLTGLQDSNQPPVAVISDQYYSLQGSIYLSSGYVFRF